MLILSPSISALPQTMARACDWWPGHRPVLLRDATGTPPDTAVAGAITVDFLTLPATAAALFCEVVRLLRHHLAEGMDPLVMLLTPEALSMLADTAARARLGQGGADTLFAGETLACVALDDIAAASPLLPVFAATLEPKAPEMDDPTLARLLAGTFGG